MPDALNLGRSVVVRPGQPPPPEWADCERRAVESIDRDLAHELHRSWRARQPLVIEVRPGIGLDDPLTPPPERIVGTSPWEWPVDLDLPGERLHHAVWANSVDGRDPDGLRWRWADDAVRSGARRAPHQGEGDVLGSDGRPVWCDGGPLDAGLATRVSGSVLHRVTIEHGSVRTLEPQSRDAGPGLDLAPDQLAAVAEPVAGARVIAPAGSGKTRVLTERARRMIGHWGIPPGAFALVAYNVRAADEMRDRLSELPDVRIRTLNALGLRLCGRSSTIDETEVRRMLAGLVSFPRRAETDPAGPWIEAFSRVRLGLARPDVVEEEIGDVSDLERIAITYRSALAERDAVDFDEQVTGAIERLLADPVFRARSRRHARILLVDEFQDLTPAHMLLIRLLSGPAGSVFAVGDDDQTIYGYAGATPRWLVDFETWFPGSATHALEVNYRCPPAVVGAASNLLTRNAVRVAKTIRPARETGPAGDAGLTVSAGQSAPATATADRIEAILAAGADGADIAVLSRVNASLIPVQVLLGHRGVPFDTRGDSRFMQRGGVRAAMAWLEVATAPADRLPGMALREAARRPKRGMSNGLLDLLARPRGLDGLEGLSIWLEEKGRAREADKVEAFRRDVDAVRRVSAKGTAAILKVVRGQIGGAGLDASATALDQWSHGAIAAHIDDLDALAEVAELEPDPERFPAWLAERLSAGRDAKGVTLASIHAVKGQEWPHVIVHHATAGLVPHRLSIDLEEERRIFHVGLTRGIRSVTVVSGQPPSPFIDELAEPGRPRPVAPARAPARASAPPVRPKASTGRTEPADPDDGAWELMRAWRLEKARSLQVPAFVVFDDTTLRQVAAELPVTEAALLSVRGIGPAKLEAYGTELIELAERIRAGEPS